MFTGTNVGLVHRFYQALQQGDYDTLTGMFHPDFVFYPQIDSPRPGTAGFIDAEKKHVDAFSDVRLTGITVPKDDFQGAGRDAQFHQNGSGSVFAGVRDQLADHQLGEVPRVSGHGQVMIVDGLVEEGGGAMPGVCDTAVVAAHGAARAHQVFPRHCTAVTTWSHWPLLHSV
ncbi:nuclear transport factor 2 family protein [Streptomyces sp. NPDC012466]|jgi:hypothetical protein|uniref:nuclear transport factor 2 family protein n=1 Tax=Streptomyces sp. NPDC012466 TaxID=3364835 RepID=UPI0036E5C9F4